MAGNVTPREFGRRFRKALSVPFLLDQVCSPTVKEFVTSYADSLGCTDKCFFFPLLTCAASCLGTDAHVQLTSNWKEPLVIWTLVLTPKSLLRIDVAEHLKQLVLQAQNEAWSKGEDTKDHLKKFLFDALTLSQLQDVLKLSNGHGLAVYNSVRALHRNLQTPEDADVMLRLHSQMRFPVLVSCAPRKNKQKRDHSPTKFWFRPYPEAEISLGHSNRHKGPMPL